MLQKGNELYDSEMDGRGGGICTRPNFSNFIYFSSLQSISQCILIYDWNDETIKEFL